MYPKKSTLNQMEQSPSKNIVITINFEQSSRIAVMP